MTRKELEQHVREMLKDDGLHAFISLDDVAAVYEDYLLLIQELREADTTIKGWKEWESLSPWRTQWRLLEQGPQNIIDHLEGRLDRMRRELDEARAALDSAEAKGVR